MSTWVVLPTYNEHANVARVVTLILEHPGFHVLVVDDGSPDGTGAIADGLAAQSGGRVDVMHRTGARGLGRSYVDGLAHVIDRGATVICQMDADLSHDPKFLPGVVAALDQHDVVIGSRYIPGGRIVNWPMHRVLLSAFANRYIRCITGLQTHDCTSGYRAWRREALARVRPEHAEAGGYAFLTEMLYEAARQGCRIGETPITFVEREEGYSKVSRSVLLESLLTPWRLVRRGGRIRRFTR
jgi:dolichol-phosphate mannosyltransferase